MLNTRQICLRLFLSSCVCLRFDRFGKQKQEHFPAFVYISADLGNKLGHISPRLFTFWPIWETNAGTSSHVCLRSDRFGKQTRDKTQACYVVRALQRANVFAARKVHWTLRLSGSALRIAFSRYALSEKAGRRTNKQKSRTERGAARRLMGYSGGNYV